MQIKRAIGNGLRFIFRPISRRISPLPIGLFIANFVVQRILRINSAYRFSIHFTSRVAGQIEIGENVWKSFAISGGCYVQGMNGIVIGDNTLFAPNVVMISANHVPGDLTRWEKTGPIRIGKNCWIGANSVILPGVELGDNVVVGAGAVVSKSFPNACVIGGVPAKIIRQL
ncbi:acyltransferase [Aureliella helgolandensis]|uniref:Maltose O-acetyltransferase n=1 Tax=Aureliella helgolandensis TaxID=2527968 RepID=A0A518GC08_9BACT|nr:acyltransferase [Aureliella helgolandensis]QDV26129.1 Maltose O-acetyltransferase [Aureliella helgolandensis]